MFKELQNRHAAPELADADFIMGMLNAHGIVPTPQRVRIGELMFSRTQHLTAEQVIETLRMTGARVSKATVYNTLNLFAARGLLRQINVDATRTCFDSNTGCHYHFHNVDTGELIDVDIPEVQFRCLPEPPEGTEIAGVDIVLRLKRKDGSALPG